MVASGQSHIPWLIGIAVTAIGLAFLCRRGLVSRNIVRIVLPITLATFEFLRYPSSGLHFPERLPFNLCNISTWAAVLAFATLASGAVEFVYFAGLTGAVIALLTPDSNSAVPITFFLNHGGIVIAAAVLVFGRVAPPMPPKAMWRAFGYLVIYAIAVGGFNSVFRTNYAYLCEKPKSVSLLDFLGPWPSYLLAECVVALLIFGILSLIARTAAPRSLERNGEMCTSSALPTLHG